MQRVFFLSFGIPDCRPWGDLTAGACRGGNRNQRFAVGWNKGPARCQQGDQFIEATRLRPHDQCLGGIDGAASANGDDCLTIARFLPEALIGATQLSDIGIGLDIFDDVYQPLAEQILNAIDQSQPTRFGKDHQGNFLVFGDRGKFYKAVVAQTSVNRIMESGDHGGPLLVVVRRGAILTARG
ncbi:hypothetical protein D3C76_776130 [compost metagenome]